MGKYITLSFHYLPKWQVYHPNHGSVKISL